MGKGREEEMDKGTRGETGKIKGHLRYSMEI